MNLLPACCRVTAPACPTKAAPAGMIDDGRSAGVEQAGSRAARTSLHYCRSAPALEAWLVVALFAPGSTMRTVLAGEENAAGAALVRLASPLSVALTVETPLIGVVRLVPREAKILSTSSAAGGLVDDAAGELHLRQGRRTGVWRGAGLWIARCAGRTVRRPGAVGNRRKRRRAGIARGAGGRQLCGRRYIRRETRRQPRAAGRSGAEIRRSVARHGRRSGAGGLRHRRRGCRR